MEMRFYNLYTIDSKNNACSNLFFYLPIYFLFLVLFMQQFIRSLSVVLRDVLNNP